MMNSMNEIFEAFTGSTPIGRTYRAPKLEYPPCPPLGTVLYGDPEPGQRPTVFVVGRMDEDGGFLDESGGDVNLAWRDVLEEWGTLTVLGRVPDGGPDQSDDARAE